MFFSYHEKINSMSGSSAGPFYSCFPLLSFIFLEQLLFLSPDAFLDSKYLGLDLILTIADGVEQSSCAF